MHNTLIKSNGLTSVKSPRSSRKGMNVIRCSDKFDFNTVVERRRQMDKERIQRIKEIGSTIDHIAKSEVKHSGAIFNEYFPFLKDMKNWDRTDAEKLVKEMQKKMKFKIEWTDDDNSKVTEVVDDEDDEE